MRTGTSAASSFTMLAGVLSRKSQSLATTTTRRFLANRSAEFLLEPPAQRGLANPRRPLHHRRDALGPGLRRRNGVAQEAKLALAAHEDRWRRTIPPTIVVAQGRFDVGWQLHQIV